MDSNIFEQFNALMENFSQIAELVSSSIQADLNKTPYRDSRGNTEAI